MPRQAMSEKTAIAGLGWTRFSTSSGTTVLNLAAEASLNAIGDAGLDVQDVDGVITYWNEPDTIRPHELVHALGLREVHYSVFNAMGGTWSSAAVATAAMAVHAGVCKNVLVFRAANGRSERPTRDERRASGASQWTTPFGQLHAAATFGHRATAHMARYGTTTLDMAHLAVRQRAHAVLNKKAQMRTPITVEDHQASRWIVYPYRLLDCCLQTDGAVAVVVTSAERARDLKQAPVYIMSGVGGEGDGTVAWESNGVKAAPRLYEGAGVSPDEIDFAELYDPFTLQCMLHMEDFGLVGKGESGAFVREGRNGLDGEIPINTHGGLLSEGYVQGLNHVVEAVQQLRPEGVVDDLCEGAHTYDRATCRQVRKAEVALVCGEEGASGLVLRKG